MKAKFKVGQVVSFISNGVRHFERVAHLKLTKRGIVVLTEYGYASYLFRMRPLTKREAGR